MQQQQEPATTSTAVSDKPVLDIADVKLIAALLDAFMEADMTNKSNERKLNESK